MRTDVGPHDAHAWASQRCEPRDDVTVTDLGDQAVLLDPRNQQMYALEGVGRFIWQALPSGTLGEVADRLAERYRLDPATARSDLHDLVRELHEAGLLRSDGDDSAGR